jgi:molybdate transport system regulatory protein
MASTRKPSTRSAARNALTTLPQALADSSGDKRLDVLRQIAAGHSISQAAREVGISYKAAWQAIDTLSNLSGQPLVERTVGGVGGGGAQITPHGEQLLKLADALAQARQQVLARFSQGMQLATGFGLRTSMRNQLPCRVLQCEPASPDDPMVWVQLRTPGGAGLTASVTRESADLLGLVPGLEVLALCKATAVTVLSAARAATAAKGDAAVQRCSLEGRVERVAKGADRDEVVLALDGGGHWVGFAPHPFTARVGARAVATMPYAALVVGLPS